jgi:TIR domain
VADVFISYSRTDRKRIEPIAERLRELGYNVWWDRGMVPGAAFVDDINRELDQARCVLVAWSRQSHNSTWVFAESLRGLETDRLVQIRIEPVRLNVPFNAIHYADLSDADDEDWAALRAAIDKKLGGEGGSGGRAEAEKVTAPPALRSARLIGVISTVATTGLALLVAIVTAPLLPIPALRDGFADLSARIASLPQGTFSIAFGIVAALAGATVVLTAQRIWSLVRAGG